MLTRMSLAAAAIALAGPAAATCLEDRIGAQCDIFLDEYRADEVPVGTPMLVPNREFVLEDFRAPGFQNMGVEHLGAEDVFYWDGDNAFIVPSVSGPQFTIAEF